MVLVSFLPASSYDFEVDGIYYNILSAADLTCEVTSSPDKYTGTVTIPSTVSYKSKDLTVAAIGGTAFVDCVDLESVEMPECITFIGSYAFKGCGIKTLQIPNSVQRVGSYAFADCKNITYFDWPDSCIEIADYTFNGCRNLSAIDLPSTLQKIGYAAFGGCGISNIELPDSVSHIGTGAFVGCTSLSSIKIGPMVKEIYYATFQGCSSLSSIEIGPNVEYIESNAFRGCTSLTSVLIPKVYVIRENAFEGCTELKEIGIAADVRFYDVPFYNCPNIYKLIVYPKIKSYTYAEAAAEATLQEWINGLNIIELELRAKYFSNVHEVEKIGNTEYHYYKLEIDSLETLTLSSGQNLSWENWWKFNMPKCDRLKQIFCDDIPPTGGNFTNSQFINTVVYVPYDSYETYTQTEPWKYFWNLERIGEPSKVSDITTDIDPSRTIVNRYDLNGRVVSDNYKGIVIVLFSDGTTKKIVQN